MKPLIYIAAAAAAVGGFFLLSRRKAAASAGKEEARALGALQATMGGKALQQGQVPTLIYPGGTTAPPPGGGTPFVVNAGGGGKDASSPYAKQVFGTAGKVLDMYYPGLGSKAAGIAQAIDSKIGMGLIAKVPGLKKLKFW